MKRFFVFILVSGLLVGQLPALAQAAPPQATANAGFLAQHPAVGWLLAGLVGFAVGTGLTARRLKKHYRSRIHQVRMQTREEASQAATFKTVRTVQPPTDYEMKLRQENEALKKQLAQLTPPPANKRKAAKPTPAPVEPVAPVASAPEDSIEFLVGASAAANDNPLPDAAAPAAEELTQLNTRYAPAQETGFLRDNKLAAEPLPQLPILLTFNPEDPEKADFTLNPHVNQAKLIGDGLHQLGEFFDFDLPTGRIAAVSADAPGQLVRQGDGWQVASRARLLVY